MTDEERAERLMKLKARAGGPSTTAVDAPPAAKPRSRRGHRAEATRVLAAGVSASAMLGIVTALATQPAVSKSAEAVPTTVTTLPATPVTIHQVVVRHLPAPSTGGTSSRHPSSPATSGSAKAPAPAAPGSAGPAPAPAPAPRPAPPPVTTTAGS